MSPLHEADVDNPKIPNAAKEQAFREVLNLPHQTLIENNEAFHRMLTDGVGVEYQKNGDTIGGTIWLIDFENPLNNNLVEKVRANTTIDWTIKGSVQARLRVIVKRMLRYYGYPPDKQKLATENILKQAEFFVDARNV